MNGYVAEGPGANFFFQKEGKLYTCPTGNILPGITRATIFELCEDLATELEEKFFTPEDVHGAESAFFVGTAAEVAGISALDDIPFSMVWEDTLGYQLSQAYQMEVRQKRLVPVM